MSQTFTGEWHLPCPPAPRERSQRDSSMFWESLCSAPLGLTLVPNSTFLPCAYLLLLCHRHSLSRDKGKKIHREETLRDAWLPSWLCCRRCRHRTPCWKPYRSRVRSLPRGMEATGLMWLLKFKWKHQSLIKKPNLQSHQLQSTCSTATRRARGHNTAPWGRAVPPQESVPHAWNRALGVMSPFPSGWCPLY